MKGLVPAYTLDDKGSIGLLGRKCTLNHKIEPIRRHVRDFYIGRPEYLAWRRKHKAALKEYGKAKKLKNPVPFTIWKELQDDAPVVMWLGISTDEADRMKPSGVPWVRHVWPLCDKGISRQNCKQWLKDNHYPEIDWSACKFCPFLSDDRWLTMKEQEPEEFEAAATFEDQLQKAQAGQETLRGVPYLHETCKPLRTIDFTANIKTHKQIDLFTNECEGMCGV